jgi:glycerol kinase
MTANPTFLTALASAASARRGVACPRGDDTRRAFLAGLAVGTWKGMDDIAETWRPRTVIEPAAKLDRARWLDARSRAEGWVAELSSLDF